MGTSIILKTFFSFCNLKELNIRYFNTNRKKFSVTVNFIQKEAKTGPKTGIVILFSLSRSFGPLSGESQSFWKITLRKSSAVFGTEDVQFFF